MDKQSYSVEPRSERNGLFPEEQSLKQAITELNNPKVSFKRSTRGYTALYENKDINPMIAGKRKKEMEALVHEIHCRYVKFLAIRDFKKHGFSLTNIIDENEQYQIEIHNEHDDSSIDILCNRQDWLIRVIVKGTLASNSQKALTSFLARIGKNIPLPH
jgi:hypothetical protein